MFKRLIFSALILSGIGSALAFGASAYFKTSTSGAITFTSGTPDLTISVYSGNSCSGTPIGTIDTKTTPSFGAQTISGMVPGQSQTYCLHIANTGDGNLNVYAQNSSFTDSSPGGLLNALALKASSCDAVPQDAAYTSANSNRGCFLGAVVPTGAFDTVVSITFVDSGDQSALIGKSAYWTSSIAGYTY